MKLFLFVLFVVVYFAPAPHAYAGAGCEARSAAHIFGHGGITADSAWHVAHGELPSCDFSRESRGDRRSDDTAQSDDHLGRDAFGFHCTWRGCG